MRSMKNNDPAADVTADPVVERGFDVAEKCVGIFGVVSVITLASLVAVTVADEPPSAFMWVRAVILLAVVPLLHAVTVRAQRGNRTLLARLRAICTVLPIAIIAVDLIPGICPPWYAVLQGLSALALVPVAVITRRREFRTAFARA